MKPWENYRSFQKIYRIYLKWIKQNQKMSTCNRLKLESLGSWPTIYAQTLPGHLVGGLGRVRITRGILKEASYPILWNLQRRVKEHPFFGTFSQYYKLDGGLGVVFPLKLLPHFTKTVHLHPCMSMTPTKKWAIVLYLVIIMIVQKRASKLLSSIQIPLITLVKNARRPQIYVWL